MGYKERWIEEGRRIERESYGEYSFVAEFDKELILWTFKCLKGFKVVTIGRYIGKTDEFVLMVIV